MLERESEPIDEFPPELAGQARRALAEALAHFEARHAAVHKNRAAIEEVREMYRRSGGQTPRLGFEDLASLYEKQLNDQQVNSLNAFRDARLIVRSDDFVPIEQRKQLWALPAMVAIRAREVEINYEVEETPSAEGAPQSIGVARLLLPERLARTLTEQELPVLDRPLRFVVTRGQRGALRADTLEELQEKLEGPWVADEPESTNQRSAGNKRSEARPRTEHRAKRGIPRGGGKFGRSGGKKGRR